MIDRSKAWLPRIGFLFQPFNVRGNGISLGSASLPAGTELVLFERAGTGSLSHARAAGFSDPKYLTRPAEDSLGSRGEEIAAALGKEQES
jgi:hypothetical protein